MWHLYAIYTAVANTGTIDAGNDHGRVTRTQSLSVRLVFIHFKFGFIGSNNQALGQRIVLKIATEVKERQGHLQKPVFSPINR